MSASLAAVALRRSLVTAATTRGSAIRHRHLAVQKAVASHWNTTTSSVVRHLSSSTSSSSSTMDTMETGTKMYMSLYPEGSTDGALRLGNIVPDFAADTTHGKIESFHEWKKGKWAILFSVSVKQKASKYQAKYQAYNVIERESVRGVVVVVQCA
jgi:hypothetical protein